MGSLLAALLALPVVASTPLLSAAALDRAKLDARCHARSSASFAAHARGAGKRWTEGARFERRTPPRPAAPPRFLELWGKFGLLNNRLRCLANALAFARRADATVVLVGSWELFADAVLDVDWLAAGGADVVVAHRDAPWPPRSGAFANATVRLSCADAYYCGGVCDGQADAADAAWPGAAWRGARAGGQNRKTRSPGLYAVDDEPALCGYAQLAPTPELRAAAAAWTPAVAAATVAGHHQRLETTVLAEPVSKMCFSAAARIAAAYYADARGRAGRAYYEAVCLGTLLPDALLAADAEAGFEANPALLLASDRFNRSAYARWRAHGRVVASDAPPSETATTYRGPSAMFNTGLGEALYSGAFKGGREGRRRALRAEVAPVLLDMLLLAARAASFWPTPGSTMSQTVCFWRAAWGRRPAVARLASCEDLVYEAA